MLIKSDITNTFNFALFTPLLGNIRIIHLSAFLYCDLHSLCVFRVVGDGESETPVSRRADDPTGQC